MLFSIYMLPLGSVFRKYDICFHCYADDTQLNIPLIQNDSSQVFKLEACLLEVKNWMRTYSLMVNADKTE